MTPTSTRTSTTRQRYSPAASPGIIRSPTATNEQPGRACLVLFVDLNDGSWNDAQPDADQAVDAMLAVAARDIDETWLADWLRERVAFRS